MNRKQRRAAETQARTAAGADKDFESYRDEFRSNFKIADQITGESYMRREATRRQAPLG